MNTTLQEIPLKGVNRSWFSTNMSEAQNMTSWKYISHCTVIHIELKSRLKKREGLALGMST